MTGIAFLTQGLFADAPAAMRARIERLTKLVNSAVQRTQEITYADGLAPLLHDGRSLEEQLTDLARATSETFSVPCSFEARADFSELDAESRFQLFMIAQEAVTNSVRHSGCRNILVVRDDRKQFSTTILARPHGPGIRGMEYRARVLTGQLELSTRPEGLEARCAW